MMKIIHFVDDTFDKFQGFRLLIKEQSIHFDYKMCKDKGNLKTNTSQLPSSTHFNVMEDLRVTQESDGQSHSFNSSDLRRNTDIFLGTYTFQNPGVSWLPHSPIEIYFVNRIVCYSVRSCGGSQGLGKELTFNSNVCCEIFTFPYNQIMRWALSPF